MAVDAQSRQGFTQSNLVVLPRSLMHAPGGMVVLDLANERLRS